MRALLHIGLEKTGTTSIQQFLTLNAGRLRDLGAWVCESQHRGNNFHLALASFAPFRQDSLLRTIGINKPNDFEVFSARQARLLKSEVAAAAKAGCTTFVISSEHLQSRLTSHDDLAKLKQTLTAAGLNQVEVVVYLRSPLRIALSHHGMAIKKGVHIDDQALLPGNPRVSHILDFEKMIDLWQTCFGSAAMNVRLYPEGSGADAILRDFARQIGAESQFESFHLPPRANTNLSEEALLILNAVNAKSKLVANQWATREFFNLVESSAAGKGLTASATLVNAYESAYRAQIDTIQAQFFSNYEGKLFSEVAIDRPESSSQETLAAGAALVTAALQLLEKKTAPTRKSAFTRVKASVRKLLKRFL
jgi:hypothetical protein